MNAWIPYNHSQADEAKYWKEFTSMYKKQYDGPDATYYRISAFMKNHKFVADTNAKNIASGKSLRLEINEYADLHYDEFIRMKGGLKFTPKPDSERNFGADVEDDVPASVDWRSKTGIVNEVQNQQQCGSCWAFSATASTESRWALKSGTLLKLAEQQLVDCDTDQDQGCNGGLMDNAFTQLESKAQMLESDYPYTAVDGTCTWSKAKGKVTVVGFTDVKTTDAALAAAIASGPVSVAVAANDQWQMYSGGVASLDDCPNDQLDHGVVAVGYTADQWIVRNSWGPSWGESGQIRLSRTGNVCGILNSASYPTF